MHPMAPVYARLIMSGRKTYDQVPDDGTLRADVLAILQENGYEV